MRVLPPVVMLMTASVASAIAGTKALKISGLGVGGRQPDREHASG